MGSPRVTNAVKDAVKEMVGCVRHIVDHPDQVEINIRPGPYRISVELYTHVDDVGQVVGRNGHLVASLRSLLTALAGKHNIKVHFDYVTEEENALGVSKMDRYQG